MWNILHTPEMLQTGHLIWEKKPTLLLCSLADKINIVGRTLKNPSLVLQMVMRWLAATIKG